MKNISTGLDQFSATYDNLNLMEDFYVEPEEINMSEPEKNPFEKKTWYKNSDKPSCIDLVPTNYHRSFQNIYVFKTGLSDFQFDCVCFEIRF